MNNGGRKNGVCGKRERSEVGSAVNYYFRLVSEAAKMAKAVVDFLETIWRASNDAIRRSPQQLLNETGDHKAFLA